MTFSLLFKLLGSLALLIYGMKMMSEALQKLAGPQLRHVLGAMTTNRFTGILTGVFVTAAVQSSTATTVLTVRSAHFGSGDIDYNGSQHRHDPDGMDYDIGDD